jgi:hypothetical protein
MAAIVLEAARPGGIELDQPSEISEKPRNGLSGSIETTFIQIEGKVYSGATRFGGFTTAPYRG